MVDRALVTLLGQRELFPDFVVGKNFDVLYVNRGAMALAEVLAHGSPPELVGLLTAFECYDGIPEARERQQPVDRQTPVLILNIVQASLKLSFFITVATLGMPLEVALQEIKIESHFAAGYATRRFFMDS